jgi:hypothetical protein
MYRYTPPHLRRKRPASQYLLLCLGAILAGLLFGAVALLAHEHMTAGRVLALFALSVFVGGCVTWLSVRMWFYACLFSALIWAVLIYAGILLFR